MEAGDWYDGTGEINLHLYRVRRSLKLGHKQD